MKERLDVLLVKRNLVESREKAKAIINDDRDTKEFADKLIYIINEEGKIVYSDNQVKAKSNALDILEKL